MPRGKGLRAGFEGARRSLEQTIRKALSDMITPYQKEIAVIQRDAGRLQADLEKLAEKIGRDATGRIKAGRARVRKLSGATKKKIARAMKARWAKRKAGVSL